MSRWETAQKIVGSVLNGRENELTLNIEGDANAQVYFLMVYWNHVEHEALNKALLKESFVIDSWCVSGTHFGGQVYIRLDLVDLAPLGISYISLDQARKAIEELEKTDPEGARILKLKLVTGVVEGF